MMVENPHSSAPFRLGPWLAQPDRNLLSRDDREVSLEPRVMQVLVLMAARPGEVISREHLKAIVWQDAGMGEDSLNRAVSDLRRTLDDDATTPRYIETIRKVGYRLVAPVTPLAPEGSGPPAEFPRARPAWQPVLGAIVLAGLAAAVIMVVNMNGPNRVEPRPSTPLTSEPGLEVRPALSPDGTRVAFVKKAREGMEADIYVGQRDAESTLRLTSDPGYESYPTWSPDGSKLAFVRLTDESAGIFTVPAIGGEPRSIYESEEFPRHLDWSADGRWIVFSEGPHDDERSRLLLLDMEADGHAVRTLTEPADGDASDTYPRFSPAGEEVAFIRTGRSGLSDVFCVTLDDGRLRRLTHGQIKIWGLDWSSEGDEVFFSSFAGGPYTLSAVSIGVGTVRRTPILSEWVRYPTLAHNAECLAYESRRENQNIMMMSLDAAADPRPLIASNVQDCEPSWSPDGTAVAFVSMRSGHRELWACDRDGSHIRQLTELAGAYVASPVWSPDGRRLAFMAAGEDVAMYVTDLDGGMHHRITPPGHNALPCSWSRDGSRVYYACDVGGEWQVWKVGPDGGDATQVTTEGGIAAIESPDGKSLYIVRPDRNGIWSRPVGGGAMECAVPGLRASDFQSWAVTAAGVVFVRHADSRTMIVLQGSGGNDVREIAEIPSYPNPRFSVSPDGKSLLFVRSEQLDIDLRLLDYVP